MTQTSSLDDAASWTAADRMLIERVGQAISRIDRYPSWQDWLQVGEGLAWARRKAAQALGYDDATAAAQSNRVDRRQTQIFDRHFLFPPARGDEVRRPLDRMTRSALHAIQHNLADVIAWRSALPASKQANLTHPRSVWQAFQRARPDIKKPRAATQGRANVAPPSKQDQLIAAFQQERAAWQAERERLAAEYQALLDSYIANHIREARREADGVDRASRYGYTDRPVRQTTINAVREAARVIVEAEHAKRRSPHQRPCYVDGLEQSLSADGTPR